MEPKLLKGGNYKDDRGVLKYNNTFDASEVKRLYTISNAHENLIRAWQGHKVEKRWFSAISGKFLIRLIKIDNWLEPSKNLTVLQFKICSESLNVLFVPSGFVSSIQSLDSEGLLLAMSNYALGEINDEIRYSDNYFK